MRLGRTDCTCTATCTQHLVRVRAPARGLFHLWHEKHCEDELVGKEHLDASSQL